MTSAHRSILARKIAAADARSTIEDARAVEAGDAAALLFDDHFRMKLKPAPLRRRIIEKSRLLAQPLRGGWYHFRRGSTEMVVAFDSVLVCAAVDAALGRPTADDQARATTGVERSIAAALARKLAAACADLSAGASKEELTLVRAAETPEDFKIDRGVVHFESFDRVGLPLAGAVRADFLCAVASGAAPEAKALGAPAPDWREDLSAIARRAEITLRAEFGRIETDLGTTLSLKPDQILPLSSAAFDEARLVAKGGVAAVTRCRLGSNGDKRALQIL